jgi:hypothetical protein
MRCGLVEHLRDGSTAETDEIEGAQARFVINLQNLL